MAPTGLGAAEEQGLWFTYPVAFAIHVVLFFTVVVSMAIYFWRRDIFPLKGRGTREIMTLNCVFLITALSVGARSPSWPCVCDLIVNGICSHCGIVAYAYRMIVLLSRHEIANELHFGLISVPEATKGCFGRRCLPVIRHSGSIFLIFGSLVGIFYFCLAWGLGDNYRCRGIAGIILNVALVALILAFFIYLGYKVKQAPVDGREISKEFRIMAVLFVIAAVCIVCIAALAYVPFTVLIIDDLIGATLMISSLWFPIYLTYKQTNPYRRADSISVNGPLKFEELVFMDGFLEAFLLHLKREFNAEGLVFWQAVSAFKASRAEPAELARNAQDIFDTYVALTAPFQLNISLDTVLKTQRLLEAAKTANAGFQTVFDSVLDEVVELLQCDPLPRFLRTLAGRNFRGGDDSSNSSSLRHIAVSS